MPYDEECSTEEIPHGKLSKQVASLTAEVEELNQKLNAVENKLGTLTSLMENVVNHLGVQVDSTDNRS